MPTVDEVREAQRQAWAGLAPGWQKWDALIMAQLQPVTDAMVGRLGISREQRHLDIATGTGEPGLTVARLAPAGHVVLTDLSPEMLDVAAARGRAQGLANFETQVCSADDLPLGDGAFDSVTVRFGYMFLPDLAVATEEFVRVLRHGGRVCASVWAGADANPWTTIVVNAVASEVDLPKPDPDAPGMFRCADPGMVARLFESAGLHDVDEWDVPVELVTESTQQYWEMASEHVSLAVAALDRVDDAARARIADAVMDEARRFEVNGEVRIPGLARCTVGTK